MSKQTKLQRFAKSEYPEPAVRKALYWCPPNVQWTLESSDKEWVISFDSDSVDSDIAKFHRRLNDQLLRLQIGVHTEALRNNLISAALKSVTDDFKQ